jgi:RNA polymerase sigma-70 factor (ECF subfamily)
VTPTEFEARVGHHRAALRGFCYRMLGSIQDADDAVQETLLGAWRGADGFEGRSSLRSWLYRIATNACLRLLAQRRRRQVATEESAPGGGVELEPMAAGPRWLEPYPQGADDTFEQLQSVELAFVAALQHLPANQRAALILCEVLGFEAAEVAGLQGTTTAAVNSYLQRARASVRTRVPPLSQQQALRDLGEEGQRRLVAAFVEAWGRSDVGAIVALLAEDARFSMPPIPTWFSGRAAIGRFFSERIFATRWRLVPLRASGQLAFACYQGPGFRLGALNVVTLRGGCISEMTGFLDPAVHARFGLADR